MEFRQRLGRDREEWFTDALLGVLDKLCDRSQQRGTLLVCHRKFRLAVPGGRPKTTEGRHSVVEIACDVSMTCEVAEPLFTPSMTATLGGKGVVIEQVHHRGHGEFRTRVREVEAGARASGGCRLSSSG